MLLQVKAAGASLKEWKHRWCNHDIPSSSLAQRWRLWYLDTNERCATVVLAIGLVAIHLGQRSVNFVSTLCRWMFQVDAVLEAIDETAHVLVLVDACHSGPLANCFLSHKHFSSESLRNHLWFQFWPVTWMHKLICRCVPCRDCNSIWHRLDPRRC